MTKNHIRLLSMNLCKTKNKQGEYPTTSNKSTINAPFRIAAGLIMTLIYFFLFPFLQIGSVMGIVVSITILSEGVVIASDEHTGKNKKI